MPVTRPNRVLVIGYGNPGRGDDGLGPALAAAIEAEGIAGVSVDIDYQLTVDHAALIAGHDIVVFVDAMIGLAQPFRFEPVPAGPPQALGSHQVSPEAALALAGLLFGHAPPAWVLAIAGSEFGVINEALGDAAKANLAQALEFLRAWLKATVSDQNLLLEQPHPA